MVLTTDNQYTISHKKFNQKIIYRPFTHYWSIYLLFKNKQHIFVPIILKRSKNAKNRFNKRKTH